MRARAIPQVDTTRRGVHLLWEGPPSWVWSTSGWSIQRRVFRKRKPITSCVLLGPQLDSLRATRELPTPLGPIRLRDGVFPGSIVPSPSDLSQARTAEVIELDLDEPTGGVLVQVDAERAFAYLVRDGKPQAAAAAPWVGSGSAELHGLQCDGVIVHTQRVTRVRICRIESQSEDDADWAGVAFVAQHLRMPLRTVWPDLGGASSELDAAATRLLAPEILDPGAFERIAALMSRTTDGTGRPIDTILSVGRDGTPTEIAGLDVLRLAALAPPMRRAFALGYFDGDPDLIAGESYEYRISGHVPASDLLDTVYGFHTVPSSTTVPAAFYLGPLRVRLRQPTTVELLATVDGEAASAGRRGILFDGEAARWWSAPDLASWSVVLDFPEPVHHVVLELGKRNQLTFAAVRDGALIDSGDVPPGDSPRLDFASTPIDQLRIGGTGLLFAVRVSTAPASPIPVSAVLPPVQLADTPLPPAPIGVWTTNLQKPSEPASSTDEVPRPPGELGFEIRWRPAPAGNLTAWPSDAGAGPPLDAAVFEIERQRVAFLPSIPDTMVAEVLALASARGRRRPPARAIRRLRGCAGEKRRADLDQALVAGDLNALVLALTAPLDEWKPVMSGGGIVLGDRDPTAHEAPVRPGSDLMELFPEGSRRAPASGLDMRYRDVAALGGHDAPLLGAYYRYRIRARDAIDRPSDTWTESAPLRLEKRVPPPLPTGPLREPSSAPRTAGVSARVLVRDAPDLTDAERDVLGDDHNAIVLRWGWSEQERELDPLAAEFRVYVSRHPLGEIGGVIESVDPLGDGRWRAVITVDRPVQADAAAAMVVRAPTAFRVLTHSAGASITTELETRVPSPDGPFPRPATGPVTLPLPMSGAALRPAAWDERVEVVELTGERSYELVLRNLLELTEAHPRDAVHVGVSCADDQAYVADTHPTAPGRPGNESNVVAVACRGRLWTRPNLAAEPALLPAVPRYHAPELRGEPVAFPLDLTPYLSTPDLGPGASFRAERADVAAVFRALRAAGDGTITAIDPTSTGPGVEITGLATADRETIVAALATGAADLADRYAVYLAGAHAYANALFTPAASAVEWGPFGEQLGSSGRYVYRVRKAGAAGLSDGTAMAGVVVVVPDRATLVAPRRTPPAPDALPGLVALELDADDRAAHVAVFFAEVAGMDGVRGAGLVRRARTGSLAADLGLRVRLRDGALVEPILIDLSGPEVTTDGDTGVRRLAVTASGSPGARVQTWACAVAVDGVPSSLAGPWGVTMPPAPVPVPSDSAIAFAGGEAVASWDWPDGTAALLVCVERSEDAGATWVRVSPYVSGEEVTLAAADPTAAYRLRVRAADGRSETAEIE